MHLFTTHHRHEDPWHAFYDPNAITAVSLIKNQPCRFISPLLISNTFDTYIVLRYILRGSVIGISMSRALSTLVSLISIVNKRPCYKSRYTPKSRSGDVVCNGVNGTLYTLYSCLGPIAFWPFGKHRFLRQDMKCTGLVWMGCIVQPQLAIRPCNSRLL